MATNREKYIDNASNEELAATIMAKVSTMPRFSSISGFTDAGKEIADWLSQEAKEDKKEISCNVCRYAISNGYHSSFMHHHICMNPKSVRYNKGVDVVKDGCDKGEIDDNHTQEANLPTETKIAEPANDYVNYDEVKITVRAWNEIIDKVRELNTRLDKLEEEGKTKDPKDFADTCIQPNDYNYGTAETKTANEMFEEPKSEEATEDDMTADEMLRELGWKKEIDDKYQVEYLGFYKDAIIIRKEDFAHYKYRAGDCVALAITEAEDKAIHKKIAELKLASSNHIVGDTVDGKVLCEDGIWRKYNR